VAERLNSEGYYPCRGDAFTSRIVLTLRCRHGIRIGQGRLRHGELPNGHTIRAMAHLIGADPPWIYRAIRGGKIQVARDEQFGCYLFPHTQAAINKMKKLQKGAIRRVSFLEEQNNG
jgi:hypothetical protein